MSTIETKQFYDEFSQSVMLKYFRQVNSRLDGVKDLCDTYIRDNAKILEMGCGVGILTKHLQKRASQIVSVDISETGLKIARSFAENRKSDFFLVNLLEDTTPIEPYGLFDAIVVADVIEHIPKEAHKALFEMLERFLGPDGVLILTFPSSQHQQFLMEKEPDKLQIIDEIVTIREILTATTLNSIYMNYFDADGKNKYIHFVLGEGVDYVPNSLTFIQKVVRKTRNLVWAFQNRRFVRTIKTTLSSGKA